MISSFHFKGYKVKSAFSEAREKKREREQQFRVVTGAVLSFKFRRRTVFVC